MTTLSGNTVSGNTVSGNTVSGSTARSSTVPGAIVAAAQDAGDRGFTFQNAAGSERFVSFSELDVETRRRAAALQECGLQRGGRCGIVVSDPGDFVLSFLGAIRGGMAPVPLGSSLVELRAGRARLRSILSSLRCDCLLASSEHIGQLGDLDPDAQLVDVEQLAGHPRDCEPPDISADDLAFLQYTSGSTGVPKAVQLTHANLAANCCAIMSRLQQDPERDCCINWLPLHHDMGLIGFVMAPLFWKQSAVHLPTLRFLKRPTCWLEAIDRHRGTITFCPPFALGLALRTAKRARHARWDLSSLRCLGIAAEPINPSAVREFTNYFHSRHQLPRHAALSAYGMAESTLAAALQNPNTPFRTRWVSRSVYENDGRAVEGGPSSDRVEHVSCGASLEGHRIEVRDGSGRALPDGREGEICIYGPSVSSGYLNAPGDPAFAGEWLRTGDLGYLHDGEVYVTGRLKDLLIFNGRNLHPQHVEWSIAQLPAVRMNRVAAFTIPGEGTESLIIAFEPHRMATAALFDEIRGQVGEAFGLPIADLVPLDPGVLPATSSGKLQRRAVRRMYLDGSLDRARKTLAEDVPALAQSDVPGKTGR